MIMMKILQGVVRILVWLSVDLFLAILQQFLKWLWLMEFVSVESRLVNWWRYLFI